MTDSRRSFDVPLGRLLTVAPGLPTTDMARTIEHYGRLGFTFSAHDSSSAADADYAIATRDGIQLHFSLKPDHDPGGNAACVYLGVEDTDQLAAEFAAAGVEPRRAPRDTDYRMRELAHVDPDGNLLLFGSRLAETEMPAAAGGVMPEPEPSRARDQEPSVGEFAAAIRRGDVDRVRVLLEDDPTLATCAINSRSPLHLFADAPGHRPNAAAMVAALVAAGADPDAHALDMWHHETPLHWAASNDVVELIDALLDAGADIEHPGSSIDGGPPTQSALGYAQWSALRRLHERGARTGLSHAAALGLMPLVTSLAEASSPPSAEDLSIAFWNACRAGQLATARYLVGRGANPNWPAPWSGQTPLDAARADHRQNAVAWLLEIGASSDRCDQDPS